VSLPSGGPPAPGHPMVEATLWLDVSAEHCEGVVWDARAGRLRFVDIPRGRVYQADTDSASVSWDALPPPVTAVHPTTEPGTLVVADGDGVALAVHGRLVERLAAPLAGRPEVRMNDANVDPDGRYFAGGMAYDMAPDAACLYRLDADRSLHIVLTGVTISNGIDWSPDASLCYFVDSPLRRVDVFDYDRSAAALARRRVFADTSHLPGIPDGLTVDADGGVWVAFFGGGRVRRFTPDGRLDVTIGLPVSQVTSCCFGGARLDELFISTSTEGLSPVELGEQAGAGGIFRARPGHHGRQGTEFRI
jgi:sugar lactone lactonase YvrE